MDKIKNLSLVFTAIGALIFGGCAKLDQAVTVTPDPVELHGDSVSFQVEAVLPLKILKKGKLYTVEAFYKYGSKSLPIGGVEFTFDNFPDSKTVEPKLSKTLSFYYSSSELQRGEVMIQGVLTKADGSGKAKKSPEAPIAQGVITTSRLVQPSTYVAYTDVAMPDETQRTTLSFFFDKGKSKLRKSEMEGEHGKHLDAFIEEKNVTGTVSIIGSHSPEGAETVNTNLAGDRAKVMENYYRQKMDEYDYKDESKGSIQFVLTPVIRDWTSLKKGIGKSDISGEQKAEIDAIIDGEGTFEEKEKKLQKLSFYSKLMDEVYPPLRVARCEIVSKKAAKADYEIDLDASDTAKAGDLTDAEIVKAGSLTPSLTEKEKLYKNAIDKTDSWQAYNNLGAVYVEMTIKDNDKQLLEAINNLEIANKKQESAEGYYNLGLAYMLNGRTTDGLLSVSRAVGMEANEELTKGIYATKGLLEIKSGKKKYRKSLKSFKKADNSKFEVIYNVALANLLLNNYAQAKEGFGNAIKADEKNALAYYCAAITAARMKDDKTLGVQLTKAVKLDDSLVDKAMKDLEFREYWDAESFMNALK
ncbi:MAG: hypothetical protein FVQ77_11720 [Cytophagales bacterium]|nr:hypothetical protein [Cytophagales bacterium]